MKIKKRIKNSVVKRRTHDGSVTKVVIERAPSPGDGAHFRPGRKYEARRNANARRAGVSDWRLV